MESKERHIEPTGNRVLCEALPHARQMGRIILVGGKTLDVVVSKVVARGPDVKAKKWELAPGDHVLHIKVAGVRFHESVLGLHQSTSYGDGNYVFLKEDECLAVVDPKCVVSGAGTYGSDGERRLSDL